MTKQDGYVRYAVCVFAIEPTQGSISYRAAQYIITASSKEEAKGIGFCNFRKDKHLKMFAIDNILCTEIPDLELHGGKDE